MDDQTGAWQRDRAQSTCVNTLPKPRRSRDLSDLKQMGDSRRLNMQESVKRWQLQVKSSPAQHQPIPSCSAHLGMQKREVNEPDLPP